jgi:hydrogenase nickel incorporation protein HypA/HybF
MHEHKFTQQIVQSVMEELGKHPEVNPQWVEVKVGEVFHLERESVLLHFNLLTQGTRLEGVELRLAEEPMEVLCQHCGKTGPVEDHHMPTCRFCDSLDVKTVKGNQVDVRLSQV